MATKKLTLHSRNLALKEIDFNTHLELVRGDTVLFRSACLEVLRRNTHIKGESSPCALIQLSAEAGELLGVIVVTNKGEVISAPGLPPEYMDGTLVREATSSLAICPISTAAGIDLTCEVEDSPWYETLAGIREAIQDGDLAQEPTHLIFVELERNKAPVVTVKPVPPEFLSGT